MNAVEFLLTTLSPVLVTQPGGGDPNSEVTLPYIPGSAIRGMLIAQWLTENSVNDAAADPTFRRLFLDGAVRFLNAYPALSNGARTLTTPLSWRVQKDSNEDAITDFAFDYDAEETDTPQSAWQAPKGAFSAIVAVDVDHGTQQVYSTAQMCSIQQTIAIHTARTNRQKVTSGATIFRYDALAANQTFASAIVAEDSDDLITCLRLLPDGVRRRLGRSQNTGYGLVRISYPLDALGQPRTSVSENWSEWYMPAAKDEIAQPHSGRLIVTLLSDAIIRDPISGAETDDIALTIYPHGKKPAKPTAAYVRTGVVGGFNRRWNLPLPQAMAIRAGSTFIFAYNEELHHNLEHLVEKGIGERRAEGFGRIAVNWQRSRQVRHSRGELFSAQSGDVELTGEQAATALQIATRILRNRLDGKLRDAISGSTFHHNGIRKAQLSRLRVIIQRGLAETRDAADEPTKIRLLEEYLNELKKPARDQLLRARIGGAPLLNWLRDLAVAPSNVVGKLNAEAATVSIGGQTATFTTRLQVEYALRLIDGVLLLAAKQAEEVQHA